MGNLRDWLNNNPLAAGGLIVVCLIVVLFMMLRGGRSGGWTMTHDYMFNLDTAAIETVERGDDPIFPPITNAQGQTLVTAYVFACNDCGREENRRVLWIERFTEEGRRTAMEAHRQIQETGVHEFEDVDIAEEGREIAEPPTEPGAAAQWVSSMSERATQLMDRQMQSLRDTPNCDRVRRCFPGR
ncbi:MAG: hypothetical protein JJU36_01825 [Phycisphaeraceae bacterium]|nr:hypothetical protein [Phycisphaeraceae bacterium]